MTEFVRDSFVKFDNLKLTAADRWGMNKYRKGPQRTAKDHKRALHRTTIMRKLPDLQQFCLIFKKLFCLFFVIFVNFGVLMNYGGL